MSEQPIKSALKTMLRASSDGIVITDAIQNIIMVNEAFCNLFSQHWRDVIDTNLFVWLEQLDPGATQRWVALEKSVRLEGECRDIEFSITTKEGMRYLSVNASLLERVADEESSVIIAIWRDITERKKEEVEVEKLLHDREERIKELNCLYGLSKIVDQPGI